MYTKKMHTALRRDTKGKQNQVTDLLDEVERLQNLTPQWHDAKEPPEKDGKYWGEFRRTLLENSVDIVYDVFLVENGTAIWGSLMRTLLRWTTLPQPPEEK